MSSSLSYDLTELCTLATANCNSRGEELVKNGQTASTLLFLWLHEIRQYCLTGIADCLINGTESAVREAMACVALGLVRPALNSLRLQIDLVLAWLYFKDHPVEWSRVQATGDGFKLRTEILQYLSETVPGFKARLKLLEEIRTRKIADPYRLLSAHIHAQSVSSIPVIVKPRDVVADPKTQDELVQLLAECSEYVSDILFGVFVGRWIGLPSVLKQSVELRFVSAPQRVKFFE